MREMICIVSTVRAAPDELLDFTHYHFNAGTDWIILFFDDPQDPAADLLSGNERITVIRCDRSFWASQGIERPASIEHRQLINANLGLLWARQRQFDWIIHIDSDELLHADADLHDVLMAARAPVVRFAMKEAVAERASYSSRFDSTLFREPCSPGRLESLSPEVRSAILFEGEYFRAHKASKVAVRVHSPVQIMGIHGPREPPLPECTSEQITLLHYDCVGFDDWRSKWERRLDGSGTAAWMRPARARQLELFKAAYGKPTEERELYARLYIVGDAQRRQLIELGLMSVISHSPEKFGRRVSDHHGSLAQVR